MLREIREAEESIRRGFAVLKRDIEIEISNLRKNNLTGLGSDEFRVREDALYNDLKEIERKVGKEVFDIEKLETAS